MIEHGDNFRQMILELVNGGPWEPDLNHNFETCEKLECLDCGVHDCPHGEPLHYHHDGCPACYFETMKEQER